MVLSRLLPECLIDQNAIQFLLNNSYSFLTAVYSLSTIMSLKQQQQKNPVFIYFSSYIAHKKVLGKKTTVEISICS